MRCTIHPTPDTIAYCSQDILKPEIPTLLHIPGFNEDSLSAAPFALRMALAGWQCIVLSPPWSATPDLSSPNPAIIFGLFAQMEVIFERVLASVAEYRYLALSGFSMGGMFASQVLARQGGHPFQAAALLLSSGDWSFLPRTAMAAIPDWQEAIDASALAQVEQALRSISPVNHAERFAPMPFLLVNADNDPRVPIENARGFYAALRPYYAARQAEGALVHHIAPGNRHELRRHLQDVARDWFIAQSR